MFLSGFFYFNVILRNASDEGSHATEGKEKYQVLLEMNVSSCKDRTLPVENYHTSSLCGMRFFAPFGRSERHLKGEMYCINISTKSVILRNACDEGSHATEGKEKYQVLLEVKVFF